VTESKRKMTKINKMLPQLMYMHKQKPSIFFNSCYRKWV